MSETSTIYEVMHDMEVVISDVQQKVEECMTEYQENGVPILPEDFHVFKNNQFYYKMYKSCVEYHDKVVDSSTRLVIVIARIKDIRNSHIDKSMWSDYREVKRFKEYLETKIDILDSYKYSLNDIKRTVSDRIKLLQSLQFNM